MATIAIMVAIRPFRIFAKEAKEALSLRLRFGLGGGMFCFCDTPLEDIFVLALFSSSTK